MLDFFRDSLYVIAGLATIYEYKHNGVEQITYAVVSYGFIAIMFQFTSHIFEKISVKKFDTMERAKIAVIIVISIIISISVTNILIPIPILRQWK